MRRRVNSSKVTTSTSGRGCQGERRAAGLGPATGVGPIAHATVEPLEDLDELALELPVGAQLQLGGVVEDVPGSVAVLVVPGGRPDPADPVFLEPAGPGVVIDRAGPANGLHLLAVAPGGTKDPGVLGIPGPPALDQVAGHQQLVVRTEQAGPVAHDRVQGLLIALVPGVGQSRRPGRHRRIQAQVGHIGIEEVRSRQHPQIGTRWPGPRRLCRVGQRGGRGQVEAVRGSGVAVGRPPGRDHQGQQQGESDHHPTDDSASRHTPHVAPC